MDKRFWKNKNVLITGYEGFLGSNLTRMLLSSSARIVGLDIDIKRRNTIFTKDDYDKIIITKGSVSNYGLVDKLISTYKIDVVFHLAAEAIVGKCLENPLLTFSSNIEGTWKVLEACRNSKTAKSIVIASSDKAYGSHKDLPYREEASLHGEHTYDVSKSCADLIAHAFFKTYGLPVAVTRCGNIYGPGDFNFSRIVPEAIRCALSAHPVEIRSDGQFTRDYVFVEDIVNGYILLAEKLQKMNLGGEAFNFSDENPITVIEFVKKIYQAVKKKPNYNVLNMAKCEITHQYLASQKARKILNWKPQYTLEDGLEKTVEWYTNYFSIERI
ncbi:MAG: CDP-glucose 4,6-dehydratase [Elusimicrobia bacterium ADurb.Bin231]|nr:MAG: CDP-glucose 4,6-dehydratase [Elusimicrobia bacterium ADurb.Bin231]